MSILLLAIKPRVAKSGDSVADHSAIKSFRWRSIEDTNQMGESSMNDLFNWIVNKNGRAYVKNGSELAPVFGALNPSNQPYLRALYNGKWIDVILDLETFSS